MRAKLLLALMGAVCAGGGREGGHLPSPCPQVKINYDLLNAHVYRFAWKGKGNAQLGSSVRFCLLFFFLPDDFSLVTFWSTFGSLVLEKNCGLGRPFRAGVFVHVSPCFQIAAYFLP